MKKAVGLLILLVFGFAAWINGFDRLAVVQPAASGLVPEALRVQTHVVDARLSLADEDFVEGERLARLALDADPVAPDPSALLAAASLGEGRYEDADRAFRVAALFGWRSSLTQFYWFDVAIAAENFQIAAERADAILRVNPDFAQSDALLSRLEQSEAGRNALATRLAADPQWRDAYFAASNERPLAVLLARGDVARKLVESGLGDCRQFSRFLRSMIERGAVADARQLWSDLCPDRQSAGLLTDGDFSGLADQESNPFGWSILRGGDFFIEVPGSSGSETVLQMSTDAPAPRRILRQILTLPPGAYTLTARLADQGRQQRNQSDRLAATLTCPGSPDPLTPVSGNMLESGQLLELPDCEAQRLTIWLRPGDGELALSEIDLQLATAP